MLDRLESDFRRLAPTVNFCSLRFMRSKRDGLSVRQDVPRPIHRGENAGAMVTVMHAGGLGYGATSDLTAGGIGAAIDEAVRWAARTAGRSVVDFRKVDMPHPTGEYAGPCETPWDSTSIEDKFDLLMSLSRRLKTDDKIVDWSASMGHGDREMLYLTTGGGRVYQHMHVTAPGLRVTASKGAEAQSRSFGGGAYCRQGGLEVLQQFGFVDAPQTVADEALELLAADNCQAGTMDILLAPDQMALQIHESIGHPLELDRILGDERNYAGTSFVTLEMIGSYRYGSELLNVTFDPTRPEQLASYGYDDDGLAARREHLIKDGILERVLGGTISQARAGVAGVASSRADTWNRPPVDRMANLNVEPGGSTFDEMVASIERGVYMKTNRSWSIDDSRNKFQFGCQWGRLIEGGKLTRVVKNPNYRGISATFWRSLSAVGDEDTFEVLGTTNCGKAEPNQVMFVAHASPACVFSGVDVFGGV